MEKISLTLLEPIFETEIRVLYGDTDAGGVVYNATYLRYFEQGRGDLMRANDLSYKILEERGFVLPVVESYLRYKAPARYDDLLVVKTSLADVTPYSCRFHCHVLRQDDNRLLVKGFTHHASINKKGTLAPLPVDYVEKLKTLVGS